MASSGTVHASAVLVGARAVLIRGPSGIGQIAARARRHRSGAHRVAAFRSTCCRRPGPSGNGKRAIAGAPGQGIGRLDRGARGRHPETHRSRTERRGGLGGRSRGSRSQAFAGRRRTHHRNRRYQVTATCGRIGRCGLAGGARAASIHRRIAGFSRPVRGKCPFALPCRRAWPVGDWLTITLVNSPGTVAFVGRANPVPSSPLGPPDRCIGAKRYRNATTARYRRKCLLRLGFGWSR